MVLFLDVLVVLKPLDTFCCATLEVCDGAEGA
jgi:hypothetical protein